MEAIDIYVNNIKESLDRLLRKPVVVIDYLENKDSAVVKIVDHNVVFNHIIFEVSEVSGSVRSGVPSSDIVQVIASKYWAYRMNRLKKSLFVVEDDGNENYLANL